MNSDDIEGAIGYRFQDRSILDAALTHSSFASEHPGTGHNERFEFLGDAVLGLAVTEYLFAKYPEHPEGTLAKIRAASVSGATLADVASGIGLGRHLFLGRGEDASGGREKPSILADAMEALVAAVHLDGGYPAARTVVLDLLRTRLEDRAAAPGRRDFKTRVQELLAGRGQKPVYEVEGTGPDHDRVFSADLVLDGRVLGHGTGVSKKEAQQEAARQALEILDAP